MTEAPNRRRRQRRNNDVPQEQQQENPVLNPPVINNTPSALPPAAPLQAVSASAAAPAARELSSVERARLRSAELLQHGTDQLDDAIDEFAFDMRVIPDGWTYEWRTHTVQGKEDPSYAVQLDMKGWQPVPVSRHPEMMPKDYSGSTIIRKGMLLMERPKEITERARMLEKRKALDQVRIKEDQLRSAPAGTFERGTHQGAPVRVGRSYEPILVPKD